MTEESKDCWQCRLVNGSILIAASVYVVHQSKKLKSSSSYAVTAMGYALGCVGLLRVFNLPPFRHRNQHIEKQNVEEPEENEYIIGKFPSKFH